MGTGCSGDVAGIKEQRERKDMGGDEVQEAVGMQFAFGICKSPLSHNVSFRHVVTCSA